MGLAEKRAAKDFQDRKFPELKQQIAQAAGFEVPIEVAWEQLAQADYSHMYEEAWTKVYFQPLVKALASVTVDDMGKEALKGALKKIVIQNQAGNYSGASVAKFEGGVLLIDHEPFSNIDDIDERARGIQKTIEQAL